MGDDGFISVVVLMLMFLITMSLHVEKISGILDLLLHTGVTGMSRGLCRGRGLFRGQDQGAGQGSLKLPSSLVLDHVCFFRFILWFLFHLLLIWLQEPFGGKSW